jgi:hypothetical protein
MVEAQSGICVDLNLDVNFATEKCRLWLLCAKYFLCLLLYRSEALLPRIVVRGEDGAELLQVPVGSQLGRIPVVLIL